MNRCLVSLALVGFAAPCLAANTSAASIASELRALSLNPEQTYRVRDLRIARGDIKIYLTEGILSFAKPVAGRTIAAIFSTANTEAGDAEVLLLPPVRSERASLASFAKTPNLDEHISSAIFFFSDDTVNDLMEQIRQTPIRPAPEEATLFQNQAEASLRSAASEMDVKLVQSLLDSHSVDRGSFYALVAGKTLGTFDLIHEPDRFESVAAGQPAQQQDSDSVFKLWCSFKPRRAAPSPPEVPLISDYQIDTVIHADAGLSSQAKFLYRATKGDGRAISFGLSSRLHVSEARIDGKPAEIFAHESAVGARRFGPVSFLLIAGAPLTPGVDHRVEIRYEGSVIHQTATGNYFVDERNTWYPFTVAMLTSYDLTFHCPEDLRVVATGELISDNVADGVRTVHRKTQIPEPAAGFNLGRYETTVQEHTPYRIELFAHQLQNSATLPAQAANILDYYTARWMPLPIHTLAISPIEGYFGQGFPGMIYLSSISYLREEDRPAQLRNQQLDAFFSEMLLPHEIAHQWWGNIVSQANYRSVWLLEAMSNYSALQYLEQSKGRAAMDAVLEQYRQDLAPNDKGVSVESSGPVDFGERLLENSGRRPWLLIVYEKGAWVIHMLRMRLGDEAFHQLQLRMLHDFQVKQIANEDLRVLAARFQPAGLADKTLATFFENWIYGTGIPRLAMRRAGASFILKMTGVDDAFTADVPLRCAAAQGVQTYWVRAVSGENNFDLPAGATSCELPAQADYLYFPEK